MMNHNITVAERLEPAGPATAVPMTPMAMLNRALASGASVEMMEKLLALQERYEANEARKAFDEAMAAAKAEIPTIVKNRAVDFTSQKGRTNYRHEDLGGIAKTIDPILGKHGLSYRFRTHTAPNEPISVTCIVSHRLGHSEENTLSAGRDESGNKNSIQAIGSTITYLQRYTLKAALGLAASNDDDGRDTSRDDGALITAEQRDQILEMIAETGGDVARLCAHFQINALAELPVSQFPRVVAAVQRKKRDRS
jgi:hypothetical protein